MSEVTYIGEQGYLSDRALDSWWKGLRFQEYSHDLSLNFVLLQERRAVGVCAWQLNWRPSLKEPLLAVHALVMLTSGLPPHGTSWRISCVLCFHSFWPSWTKVYESNVWVVGRQSLGVRSAKASRLASPWRTSTCLKWVSSVCERIQTLIKHSEA